MEITLRTVEKKDWDHILDLRNNPKFRPFFYNQKTITKKEHFQYLEKQKENPSFFNWIICYGQQDVGYIRVLDNDVSIMIDEKFHSRGFGAKALQLLEEEAKKLGIKKLVGKIMIENKSSEKIFQKNGYKLKMHWYEKNLD